MERFISNKMITTCLENNFYLPFSHRAVTNYLIDRNDLRIIRPNEKFPVKVEIANCPFTIRSAATPSISTNNQQLLQVAIDYINEALDD